MQNQDQCGQFLCHRAFVHIPPLPVLPVISYSSPSYGSPFTCLLLIGSPGQISYLCRGWLTDCHPDGRAKKGDQIGNSLGKGGGREDGGKSFAGWKEIHTN